MEIVEEFQPGKNKIVIDHRLWFPNVQSCVAFIAQVPNVQVAGAHLTVHTKNNPGELGNELTTAFAVCTEVFVIGGISSGKWSNQDLRACCGGLNVQIRKYDTSKYCVKQTYGGVDIFAEPGGGRPNIELIAKSGTKKKLKRSSFKKI
jgi:hypothetical protein